MEQCTSSMCPNYAPVSCSNGICTRSSLECTSSQICPSNTPFYCIPTQKCVVDEPSCSLASQFISQCPSFLSFNCSFDGSCRSKPLDCPTQPYCPINEPFFSSFDGQCKISKSDYSSSNNCSEGTFACPDGSCALEICGTQKTCTEDFPIKCIDGSCRKSPEDCQFFECPEENQTMCHFYQLCISNRSYCPGVSICPVDRPVKCPDDECVISIENCTNNSSNISFFSPSNCLNNEFQCPGGLCVNSQIECPTYLETNECLMINPEYPYPCSNGSCVGKISDCLSLNICENYKCLDGSCVEEAEMCGKFNFGNNCQNESRNLRLNFFKTFRNIY